MGRLLHRGISSYNKHAPSLAQLCAGKERIIKVEQTISAACKKKKHSECKSKYCQCKDCPCRVNPPR